MKKPTGTQGHSRITVDGDGASHTFEKVDLGSTKVEIEQSIVGIFRKAFERVGAMIYSVQQNAENDLDFILQTPGGSIYLELTEFVPRTEKGSPFDGPNRMQTMGETADRLLATIRKKAGRYVKGGKIPIHLIVYPTDFRVNVPNEVLALVQIGLSQTQSPFENIFWVEPSPAEMRQLRVLFPANVSRYPDSDVATVRARKYFLLDPSKMELREKRADRLDTDPEAN